VSILLNCFLLNVSIFCWIRLASASLHLYNMSSWGWSVVFVCWSSLPLYLPLSLPKRKEIHMTRLVNKINIINTTWSTASSIDYRSNRLDISKTGIFLNVWNVVACEVVLSRHTIHYLLFFTHNRLLRSRWWLFAADKRNEIRKHIFGCVFDLSAICWRYTAHHQ